MCDHISEGKALLSHLVHHITEKPLLDFQFSNFPLIGTVLSQRSVT